MAQQLTLAADAQDWPRLGQLDTLIRRWLDAVDVANISPTEKNAWRHVMDAHAQAIEACHSARLGAAEQLHILQNSQEAQKAYAWQEVLG